MRLSALVAVAALYLAADPRALHADNFTSASTEPVTGVDTLLVRPTLTAVSAALSTREKNTEFKATFVPSQFIDSPYEWFRSEFRLVLLSDTSTSVTRLTASTGYNPFSLRGARGKTVREKLATLCQDEPLGDAMIACNTRHKAVQWPLLNRGWTPAVFLAVSYDFYPFGKVPDEAMPTQQVDLEWNGGPGAQLSFEFRPDECKKVQLWFTAKDVRAEGKPKTEKATYLGGGVTASTIVWSFLPAAFADLPDEYIQEGFVPGLSVGASVQATRCDGEAQCLKLRTSQWSVTPFIDVLASSKLQFRISVPFTTFDAVDKTGTDVAGTFSVAGSIGAP